MTADPPWMAVLIVAPLAAGIACLLDRRRPARWGLLGAAVMVVATAALVHRAALAGPQRHRVGGWGAPLGIDLYADGLTLFMLLVTALVGTLVSVYATRYFSRDSAGAAEYFWPLWMFLWAALNALFLAADVFNLYVTLELLGVAAVALAAGTRRREAVSAAMRYLLAGLTGSLCYLLGVAFLYAAYGTLDIALLAGRLGPSPPAWAAVALITVGLLIKGALFPLHFWLPPAHANAPAPVSAVLSALVVKAAFYLLLRLWIEVFLPAVTPAAANLIGVLGAAAILWGSLQAIRQARLKLLVAYSTVAQLGYLFIGIPMVATGGAGALVWGGIVYYAVAHACAKAAMFLAAGNILYAAGSDEIAQLRGIGRRLPETVFAFALAGVTLMGLPPSGGFVAKWTLLQAALASGQWWWALVILTGGLLAAVYVFRVLAQALHQSGPGERAAAVPRAMAWTALGLALVSLLLGLWSAQVFALLDLGAFARRPEFAP